MRIVSLLNELKSRGTRPAIYWRGSEITYSGLSRLVDEIDRNLEAAGAGAGAVCAVRGDYSPRTIALLLALARRSSIAAPVGRANDTELEEFASIGHVDHIIESHDSSERISSPGRPTENGLIERLRRTGHPGLIVFSSGSSGRPKGILHDLERTLAKFDRPRPALRTLQFLLMDHFGGINTLYSTLRSGGVVVIPEARTPGAIAELIEASRTDLLPVTPTFLNLFLATRAYEARDTSSVRIITYGTEVMPISTLERLRLAFPHARLQQTYGLSELGVLRSRSREDGSVWVQLGGEGFETRMVAGTLHVRSAYAMIGYLNAPQPFDEEGWMDTGDSVEVDGDWIRIMGRKTDLINVGGQKVFPAEVEDVLMRATNVIDAAVRGEPHPLLGMIVTARVTLSEHEDPDALRERLRAHCRRSLAQFKVPVRFQASVESMHTPRFKKVRS